MKNLWLLKNKADNRNNKFVDKIPSWIYLLICSVGIMVLFYGTQLIVGTSLQTIFNFIPETSSTYRFIGVICTFIGIWMLLLVYVYIFKNPISSIGFTRDWSYKIISNILSGLAIGMFINFAGIYIYSLMFNVQIGFTEQISNFNVYPYVLLCFVTYLIQGGAEELVFRGFLTKWLVKKYNLLLVFLFTSILFSLMHSLGGFNPVFLTYALCFGFLLFLVAVDSNCIYKSMVIHGVYNASETLFKFNGDSMGREYLFYANANMEAYQDKAYLIISAIILVFCVYYLIKLHKKNPKWYFMRSNQDC
ncbi:MULTISPECIES: CPBP family intramembrane glutamic endopeptidase [Bacillus]|uniref:CPBP family intramembrane glutamic endopeptidase n=1 Tax=Bacillus TaxID=1386 RepID=UPI0001A14320|nr:CPBP family intramembrane glutamic endopeptidase [Bacillus pseudomycoides]EEM16501.1 CAAX amino terminal protease [Bacillus pseudomycoides DSM 12442]MED1594238.1 CPBP family intramembrane metalloprotease [Bacillus pseudomycoides]MED4713925.1 CPBP family intramembrane metalloprotease [Bacillus pseudomycoides]OOR50332.1 CAAX protease family protein [Bacillus pseudomycoides]PDY09523.1 CPBP family intramembrane metalloprotease domain-containing protein [Bacillus pseudomycoides]